MERSSKKISVGGIMKPLLSLDPGLTGTGWAFWRTPERPCAVGVFKAGGKAEWYIRAQILADQIEALCFSHEKLGEWTSIVAEFTEYHVAATSNMGWRTGDLQRLTFLCGVFAGRVHPRKFLPVTTSGWKGQLPKDVAAKRVEKIIGQKVCHRLGLPEIKRRSDTHAWDAVGIGLWALGRFK
jgi:hypothetical protein